MGKTNIVGREQRLNLLWEVFSLSMALSDYRRGVRVAKILSRFERDSAWRKMAEDYSGGAQEAKQARGRQVEAIRLSPSRLDQFEGPDFDPAEIVEVREWRADEARQMQMTVEVEMAHGDLDTAFETVERYLDHASRWSTEGEEPLPEERWAAMVRKALARRRARDARILTRGAKVP